MHIHLCYDPPTLSLQRRRLPKRLRLEEAARLRASPRRRLDLVEPCLKLPIRQQGRSHPQTEAAGEDEASVLFINPRVAGVDVSPDPQMPTDPRDQEGESCDDRYPDDGWPFVDLPPRVANAVERH